MEQLQTAPVLLFLNENWIIVENPSLSAGKLPCFVLEKEILPHKPDILKNLSYMKVHI